MAVTVRDAKAIIFDFDGLIVDTEWAIYIAWKELYETQGHPLPLETYVQCVGSTFGHYDPMRDLEELCGGDVDWGELIPTKDERIRELHEDIGPLPGVGSLLESAKSNGVNCAVASSSDRDWVHGWLERVELREHFECVRSADDVSAVKPSPELFLSACEGLGVEPSEAIVLEDSLNGLRAARRAGIPCYLVPNRVTKGLDFDGAEAVLGSLEELVLG
jgi:putative hydrolase of the HAD superfamily